MAVNVKRRALVRRADVKLNAFSRVQSGTIVPSAFINSKARKAGWRRRPIATSVRRRARSRSLEAKRTIVLRRMAKNTKPLIKVAIGIAGTFKAAFTMYGTAFPKCQKEGVRSGGQTPRTGGFVLASVNEKPGVNVPFPANSILGFPRRKGFEGRAKLEWTVLISTSIELQDCPRRKVFESDT